MMNNKKLSLTLFFLFLGTLGSANAWGRRYYRSRPYYGYGYGDRPYYYDDSGAAIAGDVIGGVGGLIGGLAVASETRKTRKALEKSEERYASQEAQQRALLEQQNEELRRQLAEQEESNE